MNADDIHAFLSTSRPHLVQPQWSHSFEQGGQIPSMPAQQGMDVQILAAIERIDLQPRVSVTDINHVQEQMARVDDWVGMS